MRRRVRIALGPLSILALVLAGGGFWGWTELRGSLPVLDGTIVMPGLSAPVTVTRDALGIPTIRGASREDVARATGFLHAQDRFFQMDLARRRAAGELSELVGGRALEIDQEARLHRFRAEARRATGLLNPRDGAVLAAYTRGVIAGLAALQAPPFEYLLLRQTPRHGATRTRSSSCSRCSSRFRRSMGRTRPRCTTCCQPRCSTFWRHEAPSGTRRSSDPHSSCRGFPARRSTTFGRVAQGSPPCRCRIETSRSISTRLPWRRARSAATTGRCRGG